MAIKQKVLKVSENFVLPFFVFFWALKKEKRERPIPNLSSAWVALASEREFGNKNSLNLARKKK